MVANATHIILHVEDLRQSDLPWWITVEHHPLAKQNQHVRLAHDGLRYLRVNELAADIRWQQFLMLSHLRQSFGQVDKSLTAIGSVNDQDVQVRRCDGIVAGGRRRRVRWAVGLDMRRSKREGWAGRRVRAEI